LRFLFFLLRCLLIQFLIRVRRGPGQIPLAVRRTASQRVERASRVSAFVPHPFDPIRLLRGNFEAIRAELVCISFAMSAYTANFHHLEVD
jgi:hypothetical protein